MFRAMPAGPMSCRLPAALLMALETVITPGLTSLRPITKVPAVTRSSSASVRENCPASVPRSMLTPAVLLRSVTVPVEETKEVVLKAMESALSVTAAPVALVVMVPVVVRLMPVLFAASAPPVPVTETVPVLSALITPLLRT